MFIVLHINCEKLNGDSFKVAEILRGLAGRIDGHPNFSEGHEQSLSLDGVEVGCLDVFGSDCVATVKQGGLSFRKTVAERELTDDEKERVRKDFLAWSGGFKPDDNHQITVYVDYAMHSDLPDGAVREMLDEWCAEDEEGA